MKSKKAFIVFGMFLLTLSIGCKKENEVPEKPLPQPTRMEIGYQNGQITVPQGTKIIFYGQVFENSATIPANTLVAVVSDNKAYLYHTSMGNAPMNDSTSRRAVGCLLSDTTSFNPASILKASNGTELATGIEVAQNGIECAFYNLKKRMAVVEYNGECRYLAQRGDLLDVNFVRALSGGGLIQSLATDNTRFDVTGLVKTYGSSIRLINSPVTLPWWPDAIQKNLDAINGGADKDVLARVNWLDMNFHLLKGIESIVGVLPVPVVDCFTQYVITVNANAGLAIMTSLITNNDPVCRQQYTNFANKALTDLLTCIGITVITSQSLTAIKKIFDIYTALSWIVDDQLIGCYDIITTRPYATWTPVTYNEILYDDFSDASALSTNWTLSGSPQPLWVSSAFGKTGLFDNMGDSWYTSVAYSKKQVGNANGFTLETEVYLDITNPEGCWVISGLGLTKESNPSPVPPGQDGDLPEGLSFCMTYEGGACWGTPAPQQYHAYFWISLLAEDGTTDYPGAYDLNADSYINGWHKMKIVVRSDRYVKFYCDGTLIWNSTKKLSPSMMTNRNLVLGYRSSGSAGKTYHDWVRVTYP